MVFLKKGDVCSNVNALHYPDIWCSTGLSVYELTVMIQSIYFSLWFLRSVMMVLKRRRYDIMCPSCACHVPMAMPSCSYTPSAPEHPCAGTSEVGWNICAFVFSDCLFFICMQIQICIVQVVITIMTFNRTSDWSSVFTGISQDR